MKDELVVLVRIGLYMLSAAMMKGGWLPAEAKQLLVSPDMAEFLLGLITAGATLVWYFYSKARKRLRGLF